MSYPSDDSELIIAAGIFERALAEAIDNALDANVSGASLALAALAHICIVLVDIFGHGPDEIGVLARTSATACVVARQARH